MSEYPLYKKNNRNQMGRAKNSKPKNLDVVCDICYAKTKTYIEYKYTDNGNITMSLNRSEP